MHYLFGAAEIGSIFGSQIGNALIHGSGVGSVFARVGASTILSASLSTFGQAIDTYINPTSGVITLDAAFEGAANDNAPNEKERAA